MAEPSQVEAVFLFNHRFERNIGKLDEIYGERFPSRTYLMPFARSSRADVCGVYETSWHFSGHVAQGAHRFRRADASHYVFVSDDLILNPALHAGNIAEALGLDANTGYIKSLASIDASRYSWHRALQATIALRRNAAGFDYRAELPSPEDALERFRRLGIDMARPVFRSAAELRYALGTLPSRAGYLSMPWAARLHGKPSDYPLLGGYADFFVVPASAIDAFVHYCGVFAALDIFAEVAVPTALALAADRVVTELVPGEQFDDAAARRNPDVAFKGVEFWDPEETPAFGNRFGFSQERLLTEFPKDWLYVHPVKLSQWK
jgi:hypothetical protein